MIRNPPVIAGGGATLPTITTGQFGITPEPQNVNLANNAWPGSWSAIGTFSEDIDTMLLHIGATNALRPSILQIRNAGTGDIVVDRLGLLLPTNALFFLRLPIRFVAGAYEARIASNLNGTIPVRVRAEKWSIANPLTRIEGVAPYTSGSTSIPTYGAGSTFENGAAWVNNGDPLAQAAAGVIITVGHNGVVSSRATPPFRGEVSIDGTNTLAFQNALSTSTSVVNTDIVPHFATVPSGTQFRSRVQHNSTDSPGTSSNVMIAVIR